MIAKFPHYSNIQILLLILLWLLTGVGVVADSLDLSDDIGTPIPQSLQNIAVPDADEVKQGFSLARSLSFVLPTLSDYVQEHLPSFSEFLRVLHTRPSALLTPLYESLCDYRL